MILIKTKLLRQNQVCFVLCDWKRKGTNILCFSKWTIFSQRDVNCMKWKHQLWLCQRMKITGKVEGTIVNVVTITKFRIMSNFFCHTLVITQKFGSNLIIQKKIRCQLVWYSIHWMKVFFIHNWWNMKRKKKRKRRGTSELGNVAMKGPKIWNAAFLTHRDI